MSAETDVPVDSQGRPIHPVTVATVLGFALLAFACNIVAFLLFATPVRSIPVIIYWGLNAAAIPFWIVQWLRSVRFSVPQLLMWVCTVPVSMAFVWIMASNTACGMVQGVCTH